FYQAHYADHTPRIYAVYVNPNLDFRDFLEAIVNDNDAINNGENRIYHVNNFGDLNTIIDSLADAILCDMPEPDTELSCYDTDADGADDADVDDGAADVDDGADDADDGADDGDDAGADGDAGGADGVGSSDSIGSF